MKLCLCRHWPLVLFFVLCMLTGGRPTGPTSSLLIIKGGNVGLGTTTSIPSSIPSSTSVPTSSQASESEDSYQGTLPKRVRVPRLFSFRFVEYFFRRCLSILIKDLDVLRIVARILHWTFWTLIALSTAGTLGIDTKPVLSLLSISLVTIGFASKDVLITAFDGMLLLMAHPFSRGQTVTIQGHRGVVQEISFKYVRLLTDKKQTVLLPVSLVYNNPIVVDAPPAANGKK